MSDACACLVAHTSLRHVQLFVTLWTAAHQALLSMGFSRQEYWSGLPRLPPGDLLTQESSPRLLNCRRILYQWAIGEAPVMSVSSSQLHVTRILEISQEESHHGSQQTLQIRASFNVFLSRRKKLVEHKLSEQIILDNVFVSSPYIVNGTKNWENTLRIWKLLSDSAENLLTSLTE